MKLRHLFFCTIATILLGGCATNSPVVSTGPDRFIVSRQAATGFSGIGNLAEETISDADKYCAKQKAQAQVLKTIESQPPYIFGNFPRVEVHFTCLKK